MEVGDFQKDIVTFVEKWDTKRGHTPNEQEAFIHLVEEVGELAREYVNRNSRKENFSEKELKNALGDILMHVVRLADMHGYNIQHLVTEIIEEESSVLD